MIPRPPSLVASERSVSEGASGWPVYAVQTAVNVARVTARLVEDGDFGVQTDKQVRAFQKTHKLKVDGVVGPAGETERALVDVIAHKVDVALPDLPDGLIRELCHAEGGDNIAAVNPYTPPNSTPGTDCGVVQLRCYEPYTIVALMQAFDPHAAMLAAAARFQSATAKFLTYGWARNHPARAQRLALLAHNWPVGANDLAFEGQLTSPGAPATWVPADADIRMLDGTRVRTRQEWVDFYAMGVAPHCGPAAAAIKWGV